MTVGEKIRLARTVAGLTQKELGFLTSLSDARIRQYELDIRTPKEEQLTVIASSLGVPIEFFRERHLDSDIDIMHALFEISDSRGIKIHPINEKDSAVTEYAISFNSISLNNCIYKWFMEKEKLDNNENQDTAESEYTEWKVSFPNKYLDESAKKLHKIRDELLEKKKHDSN